MGIRINESLATLVACYKVEYFNLREGDLIDINLVYLLEAFTTFIIMTCFFSTVSRQDLMEGTCLKAAFNLGIIRQVHFEEGKSSIISFNQASFMEGSQNSH